MKIKIFETTILPFALYGRVTVSHITGRINAESVREKSVQENI